MIGVALIGLLEAALATRAPADAPRVEIEWKTPPGCPSRHSLLAAVEEILERTIEEAARSDLHARGVVHEENDTFVLEATFEGPAGSDTRSLKGETCQLVTDAMAFVTAVAIDPDIALRATGIEESAAAGTEHEPALPPAETPTASSHTEEKPPASAQQRPRVAISGAARLDTAGDFGLLPSAAPGLQLAVALRGRLFRVEVRGEYWFARDVLVSGRTRAVGRIQGFGVGALGCVEPALQRVQFNGCGGVIAGALVGRGEGVDEPGRSSLPWLAPSIDGSVAFTPMRRLAFVLGAAVLVPVIRPRFGIEGVGTVHHTGPVLGRLRGGVEVRFP